MEPVSAPAQQTYEYCDLVMKGGITSGVIYPAAAVKLAHRYRFKNIGGTSAGAIAAAVTAAAELGRRRGNDKAFDTLATLPGELARNGHLLKLFSPDRRTRKAFRIALGCIGSRSMPGKFLHAMLGVVFASPAWFTLGLILGLAAPTVAYALVRWQSLTPTPNLVLRHPFVCAACGLVIGVLFGFICALIAGVRAMVRMVAANGFGLCSGMASQSGAVGSLTEWIHRQIQTASGNQQQARPVTFGDLWHSPNYPGETLSTERTINLEVVTTGLTEGRPFTIPFLDGALYFDPAELGSLFPNDVVEALVKGGEKAERTRHFLNAEGAGGDERPVASPSNEAKILCRLPDNEDLPILVATRMSLSFPGLLSAVPLYRVDYRIKRNHANDHDEYETRVGTKVWFSDGGICSNFPLNFFDSPLPRWPTFGLNLLHASAKLCEREKQRDTEKFVTLPKPVGAGPVIWNSLGDAYWTPDGVVGERDAFHCLGNFIDSIINTMQNWRDNLQASAPGYRDRIVSVRLCQNEGGLNLNMPEPLIESLNQRGEKAAELLLNDFDFSQHVFTRFRVSLCALQDYLTRLQNAYSNPLPQDQHGREYIQSSASPPHYQWRHSHIQARALQAIGELLELVKAWQSSLKEREGFCTDSPRPRATLQARPDF